MALATDITPINVTLPAVNVAVDHITIMFKGNQYATARISLTDQNGTVVSVWDVEFTAEELAGWGEDDAFVLNAAIVKLGIVK